MADCSRRFRLNYSKEDILEAVPNAVARLKGFSAAPAGEDKLFFKAGVSMDSWGENIVVDIKQSEQGCELRITSRCKLPTMDDNGKNNENVSLVIHAISDELKNYPAI